MLQSISSVFIVYRRKTLTGSPDPTHASSTDKPCNQNWLRHFKMKLLGLEIKVHVTVKVKLTLLMPASPWPWSQQWTLLCIQCSGVYCRELWWPGDWQAWPRQKAWPRLRLCALARISKIMIPLNPSDDLLPSFWTFFTHLVTILWSQLACICVVIEFYHQHFNTINM